MDPENSPLPPSPDLLGEEPEHTLEKRKRPLPARYRRHPDRNPASPPVLQKETSTPDLLGEEPQQSLERKKRPLPARYRRHPDRLPASPPVVRQEEAPSPDLQDVELEQTFEGRAPLPLMYHHLRPPQPRYTRVEQPEQTLKERANALKRSKVPAVPREQLLVEIPLEPTNPAPREQTLKERSQQMRKFLGKPQRTLIEQATDIKRSRFMLQYAPPSKYQVPGGLCSRINLFQNQSSDNFASKIEETTSNQHLSALKMEDATWNQRLAASKMEEAEWNRRMNPGIRAPVIDRKYERATERFQSPVSSHQAWIRGGIALFILLGLIFLAAYFLFIGKNAPFGKHPPEDMRHF